MLFRSVDSPCIANWVIKQAAELASPKAESAIKQNFYMDDFLKSIPEEKQLAELLHEVISVLNACGFRLNKFISNSHEILKELPKSEISSKYINLDFDSLNAERTLGLVWVIEKDIFTFNPKIKESENTKRGILSTIASIFDPLGIVTPSLIEPKYIIQQLWKEKVDWDEEIPFQWNKRWEAWKKEIENISMVSVPRWFGFHKKATNIIQLHIFCDASKIAYGAVAYLKCLEINSVNHSSCFLLSKSRLNPLGDKGIFIHKLEIQAAVLATRLNLSILEQLEFSIEKSFLWTDSKITLSYIRNKERKFSIYIMNRLQEIRENSKVEEWNFIPGEINPADNCTR